MGLVEKLGKTGVRVKLGRAPHQSRGFPVEYMRCADGGAVDGLASGVRVPPLLKDRVGAVPTGAAPRIGSQLRARAARNAADGSRRGAEPPRQVRREGLCTTRWTAIH